MIRLASSFLVLLMAAGCASTPPLDTDGAVVTALNELPAPTGPDAFTLPSAYVLGPSDELAITVFGVPEIEGPFTISPQGQISVPLAGTIDAAGMAPAELSAEISARLQQYIREPNVTVNVTQASSRTFTVDGQVRDPGVFRATNGLSLMRAVATAKGVTADADVGEVVIFRTVSGQKMAALYNLGAIRRGTYADPAVYPNDIIVVGDSPTTRLIREIAPVLATPLVLLFQTAL